VFNGLIGAQTGTLTATGGNVVVSSVSLGGTNPTEFSRSFEGSEKQAAQNQTVSGPAAKGACLSLI
jgi:hypothetical protein